MQWVLAENCSLVCPQNTYCKRPIEFLEPLYCIHEKFSMPKDLMKDPIGALPLYNSVFQHWPVIAIGLILIMILLQVSSKFFCLSKF